jgi:iron-sulfur cluster repair protein YtfE (RIC family)
MNATEFTAALHTLEKDHELVLEKMHALKETIGRLLSPDGLDTARELRKLRELDAYFAIELMTHMDEEEITLFPLLERQHPQGAALALRLRQEHEEIRRKLNAFNNSLGVAQELNDNLPRAVLWDLVVDGWELWELLDEHARLETDGVRQCVTRCFRDEANTAPAS